MITSQQQSLLPGLPYEPTSQSELLSTTHLFTVEILSLSATPFVVGDDGLERRRLSMELRLLELFKGTLDLESKQTFLLEVEQRRESELFVTDYHGIWSHLEPDIQVRYVVVANSEMTSPALLMQDESLQNMLSISYESDIRQGLGAEQIYQTAAGGKENSRLSAADALIGHAWTAKATVRDVFGRYLWTRVGTACIGSPQILLPKIIALILAEDATIELRRSLVEGLYAAVLSFEEPNLDILGTVIRAFAELLRHESANPLHPALVEVQIYNLIFEEGQSRFGAQMLVPNSTERISLKAIVSGFGSERSQRLAAWLDGAA